MCDYRDYNGDTVHDMYVDSMYGEGPNPFGESRASYGGSYGGSYGRPYGRPAPTPTLRQKIQAKQHEIDVIRRQIRNAEGKKKQMEERIPTLPRTSDDRARLIAKLRKHPAAMQKKRDRIAALEEDLRTLQAERIHMTNLLLIPLAILLTIILTSILLLS